MATDTRRLRVVVTGDSGGAQQAIEAVGASAQKNQNIVGRWSSKFGAAVGSVTKVAGLAAGVTGALFGLSVIQKGIDRLATIEDATAALKVALGSTAKAGKVMNDVLAVVKGTPFNLDQFATAAKNLVVFGVSAEKVPKYLHAIGEAAAASGAGAESVGVLINAFGDATTIGRITGDTIQTLASQGVPALKILANHFGVTTQEMSKMISEGEVPAEKGIDALVKGIEKGSKGIAGSTVALGGSMEGLRKTFRGSLGGMQAAMARFGASIIGPFMGDITKGMTGFATSMDSAGTQIKGFLTGVAKSPLWQAIVAKATELPAKAGKAIADFFAGLQGKGKLAGFSGTVNEIGLGIRGMIAAFQEGDVTSNGLVGTFERVGVAARAIVEAFKTVVETTKSVVEWFQKHENISKTLAITIGALTVVTYAHAAAMAYEKAGGLAGIISNLGKWLASTKLISAATKVWTAVQWALNIAVNANAIGLIIIAVIALIAVIILLWKKNETFRKIVIGAWNGIKAAAGAVADWFMTHVWPVLKAVWEGISKGFTTAWDAIRGAVAAVVDWFMSDVWPTLKTVAGGIATAFSTAWNLIRTAVFAVVNWFVAYVWPVLKGVFDGIAAVLNFLYNAVWKPIWIMIQIAVKIVIWYFTNVVLPGLKLIFSAIGTALGWLGDTFVAIWGWIKKAAGAVADWFMAYVWPVLKGVFDAVASALGWLGDKFAAIWGWIQKVAGAVADWFMAHVWPVLQKAFNAVVGALGWLGGRFAAIWGGIKAAAKAVAEWFVSFVWPKIKFVIDKLVESFKWGKDKIGEAWGLLKELARKPIEFIVNTVYNKGIRPFWNNIAEKFGIKDRLSEIHFAEGGVVPGFAPRKDRVSALLSPGEGVAVPELIKQIGVNRFLDWNKQAREGKPVAFADGGIVGWGKNLLSKAGDVIQGFAGPVVKPLLDALRGIVNRGLPGGGVPGLMRAGGNKAIDMASSWVTGKDKAALDFGAHLGGTAGGKKLNGMGYAMQMFLLRNRFPGLELISGYRRGAMTLTGNRSYHALGRAVDVPPRKDVFNWIKGTFGPSIKELIFSPMGNGQVWNGKNHFYKEPVRGQHWDHVHWAMDNGGVLPPNSTTVVKNATSSREYALTEDKLKSVAGGNVVINGDVIIKSDKIDAKSLRDELIKLGSRNGGKAGLPGTK